MVYFISDSFFSPVKIASSHSFFFKLEFYSSHRSHQYKLPRSLFRHSYKICSSVSKLHSPSTVPTHSEPEFSPHFTKKTLINILIFSCSSALASFLTYPFDFRRVQLHYFPEGNRSYLLPPWMQVLRYNFVNMNATPQKAIPMDLTGLRFFSKFKGAQTFMWCKALSCLTMLTIYSILVHTIHKFSSVSNGILHNSFHDRSISFSQQDQNRLSSYKSSPNNDLTFQLLSWKHFAMLTCGLVASACVAPFWIPLDNMKQRIQLGIFKSFAQAFQGIRDIHGWKGLFHGWQSILLKDLPIMTLEASFFQNSTKILEPYGDTSTLRSTNPKRVLNNMKPHSNFTPTVKINHVFKSIAQNFIKAVAIAFITNPFDVLCSKMTSTSLLYRARPLIAFELGTVLKSPRQAFVGVSTRMKHLGIMALATCTICYGLQRLFQEISAHCFPLSSERSM